jgi:hypothetical protein
MNHSNINSLIFAVNEHPDRGMTQRPFEVNATLWSVILVVTRR